MELNTYGESARRTAVYPVERGLEYAVLGLCGEAGELANKVKKIIRGDYELDFTHQEDLISEAGDVLWYLSAIANELHTTLQHIAESNLAKLNSRKERGVVKGDGDVR